MAPVPLVIAGLSLVCMTAGTAVLAREAPQVVREPRRHAPRRNGAATGRASNPTRQAAGGHRPPPQSKRSSAGRHPRDFVRIIIAGGIAVLCTFVVSFGGVNPVEAAIAEELRRLPDVPMLWSAATWLGSFVAIGFAGAIFVFIERYRLALAAVAGGVIAYVLSGVISSIVAARVIPASVGGSPLAGHALATFPAVHVAVIAAIASAAGPQLRRMSRILLWAATALVAVAGVASGTHLPLDAFAAAFIGITVASALHLLLGVPGRRTSEGMVVEALQNAGLSVQRITDLSRRRWGPRQFAVVTDAGDDLDVKVVHRMHRRLNLWYKLRRLLGSFGTEVDARLASPWHEADHEALVTLMAERAGVRTPRMVLVSEMEHGPAIVVRGAVAGDPPPECTDARPGEWLDDVWRQVDLLDRAGIAHHDLRRETLRIDSEGRVWILDFTFAEAGAAAGHRAQDIAEVLVCLVPLIGVEVAVESAAQGLGMDRLRSALPYLHPLALPPRVRAQLTDERPLLAELRETVAERTDTPPPSRGLPVRPATVISLCLLGTAVYLLLPQISTIDLVIGELRHAYMGYVGAAIAAGLLVFPLGALAIKGASPRHMAFWRTTAVQVAATFAARITPGGLGLVGVNYVYLERAGLGRSGAASAVALNRAVGGLVAGAGVVAGLLLLGQSPVLGSVPLPPLWSVFAGVAGLMVLAGFVMAFPPGQRIVRLIGRMLAELRETVRQPVRTMQLLAGSIGFLLVNALGLVAALAAFGPDLSVVAIVAVYLVGGTLGAAAPTPGGLGAVEAALVTGLTATGTASSTAVAGVLVFRLATFWLPVAFGPFVSRWLQRRDVI